MVDLPIENEDGLENLIYQARVEGSKESVSFDVSCANLALEAKAVIEGTREKVSATVTNEGSLSSHGAKLQFYNWDTGELLSEESLPVLGTGESYSVEFGSECLLKDLGLSAVGIEITDAGVQSSEYDDDALVAVWSGDGLIQENYAADSPGIDDTDGLDNPSVPDVDDDSDTENTPPKPNKPLKPGSSGDSNSGAASRPSTSSKLSLAKASVIVKPKTYNGKTQKCAVPTVKMGGKTLRYKTDFTYSCKAGKKIGSYKVTVKGMGKYTGAKTATFQIVPKGTSIAKLSKARKAFTVKWKKPSRINLKQTTGYQVRWSTSKKFTKKTTKTKTVKATSRAGKTCQLKATKLKAKKKYYVQVRTYKKMGSKTYYSSWSKAKAVKTRK